MVSSLDNSLHQPRKTTELGGAEGILTAKGRGKIPWKEPLSSTDLTELKASLRNHLKTWSECWRGVLQPEEKSQERKCQGRRTFLNVRSLGGGHYLVQCQLCPVFLFPLSLVQPRGAGGDQNISSVILHPPLPKRKCNNATSVSTRLLQRCLINTLFLQARSWQE